MSTALSNSISVQGKENYEVLDVEEARKLLPAQSARHKGYARLVGGVLFLTDKVRVNKVSMANSKEYRQLSIDKDLAGRALAENRRILSEANTVQEARESNATVEKAFQNAKTLESELKEFAAKNAIHPNLLQMWRNRDEAEYKKPFVQFRELADALVVGIYVKTEDNKIVGSTHIEIATDKGYFDAMGGKDGKFYFAPAKTDGSVGDPAMTLPAVKSREELERERHPAAESAAGGAGASIGEAVAAQGKSRKQRKSRAAA